MRKQNRGFSLLELLVVISIIGILMALSLASYSTVQKKARDAQRRGDIKAWSAALEQHFAANSSVYPDDCAPDTDILAGGIPDDPKPEANEDYTSACTADEYCICAYLEGGGGNSTANASGDSACGGYVGGNDETYYCMKNQQ